MFLGCGRKKRKPLQTQGELTSLFIAQVWNDFRGKLCMLQSWSALSLCSLLCNACYACVTVDNHCFHSHASCCLNNCLCFYYPFSALPFSDSLSLYSASPLIHPFSLFLVNFVFSSIPVWTVTTLLHPLLSTISSTSIHNYWKPIWSSLIDI